MTNRRNRRPSGLSLEDIDTLSECAAWMGSCEAQDEDMLNDRESVLTLPELITEARESMRDAQRVLTKWLAWHKRQGKKP